MSPPASRAGWLLALVSIAWIAADARAADTVSELALDPTWLKLGHYAPDRSSPTGWRSAIHSQGFFVDPAGSVDPGRELQTLVTTFNEPPGLDPDRHAQCRFPARLLWLRHRLGGQLQIRGDIACPAFKSWTRSATVTSISVVFATGFLGNPASYYGHTLLKFNFRDADEHTSLLDVSVSYGAILEGKHDGQVSYLIKSLTGQYEAGFSHIHFYYHDHNYGNHELRDLWEYRLDLSSDDVALVVAHAWEVLGQRYTYYFFRGNCAFRMAEILQIIEGISVIPPHRPWTIPQALMQQLAAAQYHGRALVSEVLYHPSRQSRFYEKYLSLPHEDAALLAAVVSKTQALGGEAFGRRPLESKQAVLDTLLDYYQVVDNPLAEAPAAARREYAAALSERYLLPPGLPAVARHEPESPDRARAPGWAQISIGHNSVTGDAISLRVRPAYYDALDFDSGHVRFGSLAMGDAQVSLLRDRIRLDRLALIHIESVNPGISGLPKDRGGSWKLDVGAQQARLWCQECLVARAQIDAGYGHQWSAGLFGALYAGGAVQSERADQGFGFTRASAVLIASLTDSVRVRLAGEYRLPYRHKQSNYVVSTLELRWSMSRRTDLRIGYERDQAASLNAGIGIYW